MKKHLPNHYKQGQAMLIAVIFFLVISSTIVLGIATPILKQVKDSYDLIHSKESFFTAQSGIEDVFYRFVTAKSVSSSETISLNGGSATMVTTSIASGKQVVATASVQSEVRKIQTNLTLGTGISFHYGIQSGNGGFDLSNSSSIVGNAFSSGPIIGSGNMIYGDVVSAGATGLVYGVHATGTIYAHTIGNNSIGTTVDKDAYYVTKINTTVTGTSHPNSADQPTASLPISDAQISDWESDALAGGTMLSSECDSYASSSNTCTISSSRTLGPKKIPFNVLIKSSSGILDVTGPLWVTGNITTQTGPTIEMDASLGSSNVAVIADNPADRSGSGLISIGQSTIFQGSGSPNSFVFMISQNNCAETSCGSTGAISMSQGASALVAYASHGLINLSQSVSVKETTAYKIALSQSANVTYDTGLPSVLFSAGPSGGYSIIDWQEVQ
jgi:hypothetical protein